jgi:hypothetical protein
MNKESSKLWATDSVIVSLNGVSNAVPRRGTVETWKTPLDGAKEHRLEACATLFPGVSRDLSKCFLTGLPRAHTDHATM